MSGGRLAARSARDDWKVTMANKSNQKGEMKKQGRTLKEKRAIKKAKTAEKEASRIPQTGR